jgi:hypothetical protein
LNNPCARADSGSFNRFASGLDAHQGVRRRAFVGHRRGPARCQLRRSAGDLPERRRAKALLASCRRCYASLFTDRAITYRNLNGFDHEEVALSIGVQQMVRSDLSSSGVMFSIDTETGFDKFVLITGAWGLGENVVQGAVDPDEFQVFKPFLDNPDLSPIVAKRPRRERDQDDLRRSPARR